MANQNFLIETRSLPALTRSYPRHFTFHVAHPIRSIETRSLPALTRSYPRHFTFYETQVRFAPHPIRSIETRSPPGLLGPTLVTNASPARTLLSRASPALHCISTAPAALDRYLAALPAMSLIPFAPLYLGCARSARPLPRGFTGHVAHPIRSILLSYSLLSSGEHDGLRLLRSKSMFSPASDATTRSRMKPRGRERHKWAKPRGRMELWEKRHRRQSREGSSERVGERASFKQAGATESKLSVFNDSPIVSAIAQISNI